MEYGEYDLPGDEPEQKDDLGAQIAAAESRLAELKKRQGAAEKAEGARPASAPTSGAVPGDPPAGLLARLQDRSVEWPDLQRELSSAGFVDARPSGRQHGIRPLRARGVI